MMEAELKLQVAELTKICQEHESNLLLAAEIGQQLLRENELLKSSKPTIVDAQVQTTCSPSSSAATSITSANVVNSVVVDSNWLSDLEGKIEQYMTENQNLRDDFSHQTRDLSKTICTIRDENEELRKKNQQITLELNQAKEEIANRANREQEVYEPLR